MSKRKVSYIKQDEPAFLRQFKEKVGYQEGPTTDTKRPLGPPDADSAESGSEPEDELPQVVVLRDGDLTADEVRLHGGTEEDRLSPTPEELDGKIKFKKPRKRSSEESGSSLQTSSSKKKKDKNPEERLDELKDKSSSKKVKNSSLLSFGDDEEEEED